MIASRTSPREFPLAPLKARSLWFSAAVLVLPLAVVLHLLLMPQQRPVPLSAWLLMPPIIALVIGLWLLALMRRRVTLQHGILVVAAGFFTRRIPVATFDLDSARVVDLDAQREYRPRLKVNGYNAPGFMLGHTRLRRGDKAFLLVSDRQRVLVLPQRDGRLLMLSVEKPQLLLDALRRLAQSMPRR